MESLRTLLNSLVVAEHFNTDYNKEFKQAFAVGDTVRVKLPQRYLIRDGLGYTPQPINRKYTTVAVDQVFGIDFDWDSVEAALKAERGEAAIKREYIDPAMAQIAQEIDSRAANFATFHTNNVVGILGTDPSNTNIAQAARTRLIQNACPAGEKCFIITPGAMENVANGSTTIFNPQDDISKAWKEGYYGRARGFDWYESMSLYTQTAAVWQTPSSVTIHGSNQTGSSLLLDNTSGDTFPAGTRFTIDSVFNVNPKTRRSTGVLKQFIVTQSITSSAATVTIQISPAIVGPGDQYQNVDSLPQNTAVLVQWPGTTAPATGPKSGNVGLALHRDAFALVGVELEMPKAVEISSQTRDPQTGIAVRFVKMFDPIQSKMVKRMDVLLGFGELYPDNCAVAVALA